MFAYFINAASLSVINVELGKVNKTIPYSKKTARIESNNFSTVSSIKQRNMPNELAFIN